MEEAPEGPIPAHLQTLMGFLVSLQSLYRTHPELDVAKAAFSVSSKVGFGHKAVMQLLHSVACVLGATCWHATCPQTCHLSGLGSALPGCGRTADGQASSTFKTMQPPSFTHRSVSIHEHSSDHAAGHCGRAGIPDSVSAAPGRPHTPGQAASQCFRPTPHLLPQTASGSCRGAQAPLWPGSSHSTYRSSHQAACTRAPCSPASHAALCSPSLCPTAARRALPPPAGCCGPVRCRPSLRAKPRQRRPKLAPAGPHPS